MSINYSALVFPVSLQENLVDALGNALSGGTVTFYSNTNRTLYKNVYYQQGNVDPYSYIPLPNPLTLSASGTICDVNGNDVLPGFYSFSETDNVTVETYFITIQDSTGQLVNTLYNFPIVVGSGIAPVSAVETYENLIMNGRFWRNIGISSTNLTSTYSAIVAPDQHDGYSTALNGPSGVTPDQGIMSDITFNKNALGSTDAVSFGVFPVSSTPTFSKDVAPEYFLNHTCGAGGGAETLKYYQIPVTAHLATLNAIPIVVTIWAIDNNNTGSTPMNLSLFEFQGTGQASSVPAPFKTFTLSGSWTKYSFQTTTPATSGDSYASGPGDDAMYLWVGIPTNVPCNISFAIPSIYIGYDAPTTSFSNYDQINAIISSPRTGDVRTSLNSFYPFGWLPMNDGSIGSTASGATTRANTDTWQLYSLIWNSVSDAYAAVTGGRGTSALADFTANKSMNLTKALGQVFAGTASGSTALGTTLGASSSPTTLVAANIPQHTHTTVIPGAGSGSISGLSPSRGGTSVSFVSDGGESLASVPLTTPPTPFSVSVMQPTVYMNVYIKL